MLNNEEENIQYTLEEENSYQILAETMKFKNMVPRHKESLRDLKWQEFQYSWRMKKVMMKEGFKRGAISGSILGLVLGLPFAIKHK